MKDLTFSIYYTPNNHITQNQECNFTCWDNKIHIRFRDFNKEELIIGLEKKLTYLLTYLMNYSYLPKVIGMYDEKTLIDSFLKTSDVYNIISAISLKINEDSFRGFKLHKNYKKKEIDIKPFGAVDENCFPLLKVDDIIQQGSLDTFLKVLRVDLDEYLFNDSYVVVLRENKQIDINKKFINKAIKKNNRISGSNLDIVELW